MKTLFVGAARHRIAVARAAKSLLHAALNSTMKLVLP
jgi:hypothetical protein